MTRRQIVCLCGSGRFHDEINQMAVELTDRGYVVLMPHIAKVRSVRSDAEKAALDVLHLDKIDLADEVHVVCPGGYVGESTAREICYAARTGKIVSIGHHENFVARLRRIDQGTKPSESMAALFKKADDYVLALNRPRTNKALTFDEVLRVVVGDHPGVVSPTAPSTVAARADSPIVQAASKLHADRRVLIDEIVRLRSLVQDAWGLIANVNSGAWHLAGSEWKGAAERWRSKYHAPDSAAVMALIQPTLRARAIIETVHMLSREATSGKSVETLIGSLRELAELVGQWADTNEATA